MFFDYTDTLSRISQTKYLPSFFGYYIDMKVDECKCILYAGFVGLEHSTICRCI